ncbi:cytochrome c3 family protein, partial [bacterium]|nr:cytochrome c3 family protein [bacterium]MBU1024433.1 cytochrome c3 family protein [bacterium]
LWFSGTINIDPETMKANVVPDRASDAHYKMADDVQIDVVVNSIDTVNWIVDVDVTIHNTLTEVGFDVRLIIMASSAGHRLLNADDWTRYFDEIGDGYPINPFKAYAKAEPSREFLIGFAHTENLLISIPGGNTNVRFAIDASWPQNCEEPYEINGFTHGELWDTPGSSATAEVDVLAWNDDVNSVELYLPDVTGVYLVPFTLDTGNHWTMNLVNDAGAAAGEYVGYVVAKTTGSGVHALYDEVLVTVTEEPVPEYVGSARCGTCHSGKHDTWSQMGHHFMLNKVEGAEPDYPFSTVPNPPPGYSWNDISYMLDGFGHKAYFLDSQGYFVTGDQAAWVLDTEEWVAYSPTSPPGTKPYSCGQCHTVGWVATGAGGPHQDDLPGIYATFSEAGIGCEKCHGPGSDHVNSPSPDNIQKDSSSEFCGECHKSGALDKVPISGGFVKSHARLNEVGLSPHGEFLTCNSCHDVHASTKYDDLAAGTGVKKHCTDCHSEATHQVAGGMASLACTDCHMPNGAKAVVTTGEGVHEKADSVNHIFRIDTTGVTLEDYFETDGSSTWIKPIDGEIRLNLAWACMQCHDGVDAFEIDSYEMAAARAKDIHNPTPDNMNVGSDVCGACHTTKHENWSQMGHHYMLNKVEGAEPDYPFSTVPNPPPGYTWADISYMLDGFGHKAYFLDAQGYFVTGDQAAWLLDTEVWVAYSPTSPPGTKPYSCGQCHNVGWVATGAGGPHQDNLPGIYGTFDEAGIGCERCHGPGNLHIRDDTHGNITVDNSNDFCGACHKSGDLAKVPVADGLVKSHARQNEIVNSPHSFFTCNTCHDVHASTKYDDLAPGTGVKMNCTDCHEAATHQVSGSMAVLDCTDCHMPYGAKAAVTHGTGVHLTGDSVNHIFRIDTTGVTLANYFETDGTNTWIKPINGAIRLNLAWACMQCHDGNHAFKITSYTMAAAVASGIHEP